MYGKQGLCAVNPSMEMANRVDSNPTVGENLETRIAMLKAEVARLEASRETLSPLLGMHIRDIRDAMNF